MARRKSGDVDISGGQATDPGDETQAGEEGAPEGGQAIGGNPARLPSDDNSDGVQTGGPEITAGAGGPASSNKQGESMTALKTPPFDDEGARDPDAETPRFGNIADARARLKKERGLSDAQVLSMNDEAVHKALADIDDVQAKRNAEQKRNAQKNQRYQTDRPGTPDGVPPTIGDSGYNRKNRNKV